MPIHVADRHSVVLATAVLALASPLGPGGCRDIVVPFPLPTGAVRFAPPPVFARWWPLVEGCSGHTSDFAVWTWYHVPAGALRAASLGNAEAYTDVAARRVVLTAGVETIGSAVRHEMLHALLGPASASGGSAPTHPPAYFQGRCAGVVFCPDVKCADAGPAPVAADAPTVPLAALTLEIDAIPARVSRTGADRALTIVLRATNPSARPAWVPLDPTPGVPAPRVAWRGFRIVPAAQPLPVTDLTRVDATGIVAIDTAGRALVGSLATAKAFPKDVDLLVTLADDADVAPLATLGRQLQGRAQGLHSGADLFLASPSGVYLGRTCPWRTCAPGHRVRCGARYRTGRPYVRDDLGALIRPPALVASPPLALWPRVVARAPVPADVDVRLLVET